MKPFACWCWATPPWAAVHSQEVRRKYPAFVKGSIGTIISLLVLQFSINRNENLVLKLIRFVVHANLLSISRQPFR